MSLSGVLGQRDINICVIMVVGFYAPHLPFVTEEKRYRKYLSRFADEQLSDSKPNPVYQDYVMACTQERVAKCKAAYCGEVEILDSYIGRLYDVFRKNRQDYLSKAA